MDDMTNSALFRKGRERELDQARRHCAETVLRGFKGDVTREADRIIETRERATIDRLGQGLKR